VYVIVIGCILSCADELSDNNPFDVSLINEKARLSRKG